MREICTPGWDVDFTAQLTGHGKLKFSSNTTFGSCALVLDKDIFLHAFYDKTGYDIIYHGTLK